MTRRRLAIAAAACLALTPVCASAQVGIGLSFESRGYGGPLHIGPNFKSNTQEPSARKAYNRSTPRKVTRARKAQPRQDVETAKSTPAAPAKDKAQSENSTIASVATEDTVETSIAATTPNAEATKPAPAKAQVENSTIASVAADTTAATAQSETASPATKTSAGCKRYFPTVGQTITVPCD